MRCVNALIGRSPFLQREIEQGGVSWDRCVNALIGRSPFLLDEWFEVHRYGLLCQCPDRAFSISTHELDELMVEVKPSCQCPDRAFSISTKINCFIKKLMKVSMP